MYLYILTGTSISILIQFILHHPNQTRPKLIYTIYGSLFYCFFFMNEVCQCVIFNNLYFKFYLPVLRIAIAGLMAKTIGQSYNTAQHLMNYYKLFLFIVSFIINYYEFCYTTFSPKNVCVFIHCREITRVHRTVPKINFFQIKL